MDILLHIVKRHTFKDYYYGQKCETNSNIKDYKHVPIHSQKKPNRTLRTTTTTLQTTTKKRREIIINELTLEQRQKQNSEQGHEKKKRNKREPMYRKKEAQVMLL